MSVNKVDYRPTKQEDTNRGHSPSVWGDCPIMDLLEDPRKGVYFRDDFVRTALLATPTITTQAEYANGWKAFGSAAATVLGAGVEGGQGLALFETNDNAGANIATLALPFKINRSKGAFWYEVRLKHSTVTTSDSGFLAGLMDSQTLTAILPITAAGALADVNFVGFQSLESAPANVNTLYKANGVTAVTVKSGAITSLPTTTAIAADTYIKLGMKYEPSGPYGSFQLSFFVNGYRLPDRKQLPVTADGTDFPDDVQMGLVIALLLGSANDSTLTVDWVEAAQLSADTGAD